MIVAMISIPDSSLREEKFPEEYNMTCEGEWVNLFDKNGRLIICLSARFCPKIYRDEKLNA